MDDAASQVGEGRTRPRTDMDQGVAMELDDLDPRNIENDVTGRMSLTLTDSIGGQLWILPPSEEECLS